MPCHSPLLADDATHWHRDAKASNCAHVAGDHTGSGCRWMTRDYSVLRHQGWIVSGPSCWDGMIFLITLLALTLTLLPKVGFTTLLRICAISLCSATTLPLCLLECSSE